MQLFSQLFSELDSTTRTIDKVQALERYFAAAEPRDAVWALYFLTGNKIKRAINTRLLGEWARETTELPEWLLGECYDAVGDFAETMALLLPESTNDTATIASLELHELVEQRIVPLRDLPPEKQRELIVDTWRLLGPQERFLWHKLILGEFRVGIAKTLVIRAFAGFANVPADVMAHRLMGQWQPTVDDYEHLRSPDVHRTDPGRPYPFYLASPLESPVSELGDFAEWQAEWKWDGIRAQLIHRQGQVLVWSRGEELVTDRFPEVAQVGQVLPEGTVLDGEILCWSDDRPLPFAALQKRIGRKSVGAKLLKDAPVVFMAFDLLELDGLDLRETPLAERRSELETLAAAVHGDFALRISPAIVAENWEQLAELRATSRSQSVEGLMLKRLNSPYRVGRPRGDWWKWKIDPYTIDAVLIYAQRGHGRRASLYTDYTFGVWHEGELVPVAKAYSGLSDAEIAEVDAFVRRNIVEAFGPVRRVTPELVFELHFEGLQLSTRHKSGIAVRFPRIARWRKDKKPEDADTLEAMKRLAMNFEQ
jgi:DNA ligase-1